MDVVFSIDRRRSRGPTAAGAWRTNKPKRRAVGHGNGSTRKIMISLSPTSARAFEEIKFTAGVRTESEVFQNALRLHLTLLRAHSAGVRLFMKRDGSEECVPVALFEGDQTSTFARRCPQQLASTAAIVSPPR
jgi:hypothetical protein